MTNTMAICIMGAQQSSEPTPPKEPPLPLSTVLATGPPPPSQEDLQTALNNTTYDRNETWQFQLTNTMTKQSPAYTFTARTLDIADGTYQITCKKEGRSVWVSKLRLQYDGHLAVQNFVKMY